MPSTRELQRLAAGLFMVGFDGHEPDAHAERLIDMGVFGAILFRRNVVTPAQVAAFTAALKGRAGRPFAMAVDQEGGRVARLRGSPFIQLPPMRTLGASGDEGLLERVGRLLAYEVRSVGFDWDFAPVLDVDTNPDNPVIGDRSFHHDAGEVARLGVALAKGMESGGVASCAKHFPGHGDTSLDSHLALPRLPHAMARLQQIELRPFTAYARANLASVMTAHVVFEALEPKLPATMTPKALGDLLRGTMGFQGVIVSDDLEMKAIAANFATGDAVVAGLDAGVDLFLVCHTEAVQLEAIDAVVRAVESGRLTRERLETSRARLERLAKRFVRPPERLEVRLGSAEHLALGANIVSAPTAMVDPTERHA